MIVRTLRHLWIPVLALLVSTAGTARAQGAWTGHVNFFIGQTALRSADWAPLDEQEAAGLEVDFRNRAWPVNIAIDVVGSDDQVDALVPGTGRVVSRSVDLAEIDLGVRKYWDGKPFFHPFAGGGIALVTAELQFQGVEEEDDGVGFWVDAGASLALSAHFNVGLDLRYSWAEVTLLGESRQAGGLSAGALIGFRW